MTVALPTLAELNRAARDRFTATLSGLYEHSPWVPERAHAAAPFASVAELHAALANAVRAADDATKLKLLRSHPDLAGKFGAANPLTAHSLAEQSGAGLDRLTEPELARFQQLNRAYRERFEIPFIICVRRHTKDSILRQFERRLARERAEELSAAIEEITRIAALRLEQSLVPDGSLKLSGRLSTHVLDTHCGRPAQGIGVELVELSTTGPARNVVSTVTNADGRTDSALIAKRPVPIGTYELRFSVAAYFAAKRLSLPEPPFLDVVPIRFSVADPEGQYHVPLLVTPWSYTTYRGS